MPSKDQASISIRLSYVVQRIRSRKDHEANAMEIRNNILAEKSLLFLKKTKKPINSAIIDVGI